MKTTKKAIIGILGGLVILAGIAMLVLPGPAFIVIPAGLAILATEFEWAHNLKERLKHRFEQARKNYREKRRLKHSAGEVV